QIGLSLQGCAPAHGGLGVQQNFHSAVLQSGSGVAGVGGNLLGSIGHHLIELTGDQSHDEVESSLGILGVLGDRQGVSAGVSSRVGSAVVNSGVGHHAPVNLGLGVVVDLSGNVVSADDHSSQAVADLVLAGGELVGS